MKLLRLAAAVLSLGSLVSTGAQAASCNGVLVGTTCTLTGPDIAFQYDVVTQAAAMALYGAPTIVGDAARFVPPAFRAESLNGAGAVTVTATFTFDRVYSLSNLDIGSVVVTEAGDYSISGDTGVPDTVSAALRTQVANNASAEFATDLKNFNASGNSVGAPTWVLISSAIDPATAFTAVANDINVQVQNTLTAVTDENGGDAWIQKKFVVEVGTVAPVPVPAAAWLFGSALGLLGLRRRMS